MRIAKALFGLIGSAIVGLFVAFAAIPDWTMMNLNLHFWQTVGGFLISAAFGGAAVFIAYAAYMGWKLGDNPVKAFDELRKVEGFDKCESLAEMVKPAQSIMEKRDELSAKDARIAELEKRPTEDELDAKNAEIARLAESACPFEGFTDAQIDVVHLLANHYPNTYVAWLDALRTENCATM